MPHGNHDDEKHSIRKDSAIAQVNIVRLLPSLTTSLNYRLGMVDLKGAHLQSGPIKRTMYVRPPTEWSGMKQYEGAKLWKLTKLLCGIAKAGRQRQETVENWMMQDMQLKCVKGISQLFVKRNTQRKIYIITAKVTDDLLYSGSIEGITQYIEKLRNRFTVGKFIINELFLFNGCELKQDSTCSIRMTMNRYLQPVRCIPINRNRNKHRSELATRDETLRYLNLSGTLMYMESGVLPQAVYATSNMQQELPRLRV